MATVIELLEIVVRIEMSEFGRIEYVQVSKGLLSTILRTGTIRLMLIMLSIEPPISHHHHHFELVVFCFLLDGDSRFSRE